MRKIGILGGTFNPIHMGHLTLAEWTREAFSLDEIWFIPTGCSYLKAEKDVLPGRERLNMTELALRGNPFFRCLDIEVAREGSSYSYETLELLKRSHPGDDLYFIVGEDCLFSIENWKEPGRIFQSCTLIAASRAGETDSGQGKSPAPLQKMEEKRRELQQRFHADILLFPFFHMPVSSTEIRGRIREGKSVRYLVPDRVLQYIEEKRYYRE